jgi:hypothetical protein
MERGYSWLEEHSAGGQLKVYVFRYTKIAATSKNNQKSSKDEERTGKPKDD